MSSLTCIKQTKYSIVLVLEISFSFYCPSKLTLFIHLVNCSSIPCFSALNSYRFLFKSSFWRFNMLISEDIALTSEVLDFLKYFKKVLKLFNVLNKSLILLSEGGYLINAFIDLSIQCFFASFD